MDTTTSAKNLKQPPFVQGDVANLSAAFDEIKSRAIWVNWCPELKNGKWTKPPFDPNRPNRHARNNDPSTWGSLDQAIANVKAGKAFGIGKNLLDSDKVAFDCDHCRDPETGEIDPRVMELVEACDSYAEYTPSGTGIRIIGRGSGRSIHMVLQIGDGMQIEVYSNCARYITITNLPLPGTPNKFADLDGQVDALIARYGSGQSQLAKADDPPPSKLTMTERTNLGDRILAGLPAELRDLIVTDPGKGKRSDAFHGVVLRLHKLGHDLDSIEAVMEDRPVSARYEDERRLRKEIARCLDKDAQKDRKNETALQALYQRLQGMTRGQTPETDELACEWPANPLLLADGHPRENARVDYLIEGKVQRVSVGFGLGPWGGGKSFVAEDACGAIMTAGTFAGSQVTTPGGVLWLAYEAGNEVAPRLMAYKTHKLGTDRQLPFAYSIEPPRLQSDFQGLAKLVGDAALWLREQHGVELRLIVIDTLAAAGEFKDENSSAEIQAVGNMLAGLARSADCAVLVVDHLGKNKEAGARGSSAKEALADFILVIDCDRTQEGETSNHRLSVRKLRGGPSGSTMPFKLRVVETPDRDGVLTTSCIVAWGEIDAAAPKPTKLSLRVEKLLTALDRARGGKDAVQLEIGPMKVRAVARETLRDAFYAIYPAESQNAKRQGFNAAIRDALSAKLIGMRTQGESEFYFTFGPSPEGKK